MPDPYLELRSIQSMLASGHRCVRLEPHSLFLFGALGGCLSIGTDWAITAERFPELGQRALAMLVWLATWLIGVSLLDHWLTRRVRESRAQTVPFAQAQITRAWWLLLSVGALGSFAMFFHGGGQLVYALWMVLLGLGIYLFGLFSRPLVEWIGVATILLGVVAMAAGLPLGVTRWLNACCFAVGIPLAGGLARWVGDRAGLMRAAALLLWILVVVSSALLAASIGRVPTPSGPLHLSGDAAPAAEDGVLRLERGTRLPLRLNVDGPIASVDAAGGTSLVLSIPVELALRSGQPDGRYRLDSGPWRDVQAGGQRLLIDSIRVGVEQGRAEIRVHALLDERGLASTQP